RMPTGVCECSIAAQAMAPIDPGHFERLMQEQRSESGTVEEEIARDRGAVLQLHACDVSRLGCAQHVADLAFDASHAALFGVAAQIASIERGVEMIGIAQKRSGCSRDS